MNIYIPTIRARQYQTTFNQLNAAGLRPILVPDEQCFMGDNTIDAQVLTFPKLKGKGIAAKRQAIMEYEGAKPFCMIDDDIVLQRVRKDGHIVPAKAQELKRLFTKTLPRLLTKYAHGGIGQRLFINSTFDNGYPYHVTRGHYRQVLCMNPALFKRPVNYEFDSCEDLWMFTQLCMEGLDWFTYNGFCINERNSKAAPPTWSMEHKSRVMREIFARVPHDFIAKGRNGNRVEFRKLCMANGGRGR